MPITITITDPTPEQIAALFGYSAEHNVRTTAPMLEARDPGTRPRSGGKKAAPQPGVDDLPMTAEDAELAREIAADIAEAPPEPEGARQVVDAGTGKPAGAAPAEVAMTMDEVRASATRLAQADAGQLKAILGEFGAGKLSEVPAGSLGEFAGRVLAALG